MPSYRERQRELFDSIERDFKRGLSPFQLVEPVQDYEYDQRLCLTSVAFIPLDIQKLIQQKVILPLENVDYHQYYYVPASLHITIQNIQAMNFPPSFDADQIQKTTGIFEEVIPRHKLFSLQIEGLFEQPTSLSLRAYSDERLKNLVLELRNRLEEAGIPDNKSYASPDVVFANISFCRYKEKPNAEFFKQVERLREVNIGGFTLTTVSLITTNVACFPLKTSIIKEFRLSR